MKREYPDPGDLRNVLNSLVDFSGKIAALDRIDRLKREADATDRRRCGSCEHWMKSSVCPREHNVKGYSRGPSCDAYPCGKFQMQQWVIALKAKRMAEVDRLLAEYEAAHAL